VREIARLTGIPAGSLHRELKGLAAVGLLQREPHGNQITYRANRSHPVFAELSEIFRKTSGLADLLRDALATVPGVEIGFIFGSVAQGTERGVSDIDLFVVGSPPFADIVKAMTPLQPRLGREVNPVVMPREEVREKLNQGDRFLVRVAGEPKIFLVGTEDDFRQLGKDRPA
jgi:predicted nucleotidyltransferase